MASASETLPVISVSLNMMTTVLVASAMVSIKRGWRQLHRLLMFSGLATSAAFLASYLAFHYFFGVFRYQGEGLLKTLHWVILGSHTVLAVGLLPMILMTVYHAFRGQTDRHRRLGPYTAAAWLYVSVTGVILFALFTPAAS